MEIISFIRDSSVETRKEWVEKTSSRIVSGIEGEEDKIAYLLEFSMNNGSPTFNEKSFIDFVSSYRDDLPDMLSRLDTESGFSSTIKSMSFDEIVSLSNELASHVGVNILCKLCDHLEKK